LYYVSVENIAFWPPWDNFLWLPSRWR